MRQPNRFGLTREIAPLSLASFVAMLSVGTLSPFLSQIAASLNTRVSMLGLASTAALAATAVGGLVVGPLSDQVGHRTMLLWGLVLTGVGAAGTALAPSVLVVALARTFGGVGFSAASGMPNAIAASRYEGPHRQRSLAILMTAGTVAGLAGAPLMTTIGAATSWRVAFLIVAGATMLAAVAISLTIPRHASASTWRLDRRTFSDRYAPIMADRRMRLLYAATATQMFGLIGSLTYAGAFLADQRGFALPIIGWAYMAQSAGGIAGGFLAGSRLVAAGLARVYALAMLGMGGLFALFFAAPLGGWAVLPFALTGLAQVAGWIVLTTMLAERSRAGQGTTMALNGSLLGVGGAAGSAIGGITIDLAGYETFGALVLLMAMASALLGWAAYRLDAAPATYNDVTATVMGREQGDE